MHVVHMLYNSYVHSFIKSPHASWKMVQLFGQKDIMIWLKPFTGWDDIILV